MADENLSWVQLVRRLAIAAERPARTRVHEVPAGVLRAALATTAILHGLVGKQAGLNPMRLAYLLTSEMFIDPATCREELGVVGGDLDAALRDIVEASERRTRQVRTSSRSG